MALTVGSRLGHYDVTALIGEGGMGQVYQASDTKLGRKVALKILPEAFAADPDRLARFQREAQVLASLNHPGIAAIYGIEEQDDTRALVLELVEGPTLADRIAQGPIPVDEALPIATQIAEALEAAHEAGVIHRDLKPANIKVREDGTVKVLDFGLAKALDTAPEGDPSQSPTLTAAATQMGVIMGTAAYMSPEQARGKPVDKRADIWAFGCVLFEMLTAQRAFVGEDVTQTIAKLVEREPDWSLLRAMLPKRLTHVVHACLQKDPRQRLRDAGDVRLGLAGEGRLFGAMEPSSTDASSRTLGWTVSLLGGGVVAGVVLAALFVPALTPEVVVDEPRTVRLTMALPPGDTLSLLGSGADARSVAVSRDGTRVVFVANRDGRTQLFSRLMSDGVAVAIPGTEDARDPFFNPDGSWVGFFARGGLSKVALAGGSPLSICSTPQRTFGASWGPDETIVFSQRVSGLSRLFRVSSEGGEPEQLTALDSDERRVGHPWPHVLPGGRWVLFTIFEGASPRTRLALLSLESGERRELVPGKNGRYVPSGHIVFLRDQTLWAMGFDVNTLEITAEPVPVLEGVLAGAFNAAHYSTSDDGVLVYVAAELAGALERQLQWIEPDGASSLAVARGRDYFNRIDLSPDGTQVALAVSDQGSHVWTVDLVRGTHTQLSLAGDIHQFPVWSNDGTRVAFLSDRAGTGNLYVKTVAGGAEAVRLTTSDHNHYPSDWTRDDTMIIFDEVHPETNDDIWTLSLGDGAVTPFLVTPASEARAVLSPDGRWMAYDSDQSGQREVFLMSYPAQEGRTQVSTDGGRGPRWSANGSQLFYVDRAGTLTGADIQVAPQGVEVGTPRAFVERVGDFDVDSDGRFLVLPEVGGGSQIEIVLDWSHELERLVRPD